MDLYQSETILIKLTFLREGEQVNFDLLFSLRIWYLSGTTAASSELLCRAGGGAGRCK